jgi:hypothetical protein
VAQRVGRALGGDEVELEVLPGGDVAHAGAAAPGVLPLVAHLLAEVGEAVELVGGEPAVGDLDPDHLVAGLALAVDAVAEPVGLVAVLVLAAVEEGAGAPLELGELLLHDGGKLVLGQGCGGRGLEHGANSPGWGSAGPFLTKRIDKLSYGTASMGAGPARRQVLRSAWRPAPGVWQDSRT